MEAKTKNIRILWLDNDGFLLDDEVPYTYVDAEVLQRLLSDDDVQVTRLGDYDYEVRL